MRNLETLLSQFFAIPGKIIMPSRIVTINAVGLTSISYTLLGSFVVATLSPAFNEEHENTLRKWRSLIRRSPAFVKHFVKKDNAHISLDTMISWTNDTREYWNIFSDALLILSRAEALTDCPALPSRGAFGIILQLVKTLDSGMTPTVLRICERFGQCHPLQILTVLASWKENLVKRSILRQDADKMAAPSGGTPECISETRNVTQNFLEGINEQIIVFGSLQRLVDIEKIPSDAKVLEELMAEAVEQILIWLRNKLKEFFLKLHSGKTSPFINFCQARMLDESEDYQPRKHVTYALSGNSIGLSTPIIYTSDACLVFGCLTDRLTSCDDLFETFGELVSTEQSNCINERCNDLWDRFSFALRELEHCGLVRRKRTKKSQSIERLAMVWTTER